MTEYSLSICVPSKRNLEESKASISSAIGFCDRSLNVCETRSYRYDYTWQEQYKAECKMFKQNKWENTAMHPMKTNKGWHG